MPPLYNELALNPKLVAKESGMRICIIQFVSNWFDIRVSWNQFLDDRATDDGIPNRSFVTL